MRKAFAFSWKLTATAEAFTRRGKVTRSAG